MIDDTNTEQNLAIKQNNSNQARLWNTRFEDSQREWNLIDSYSLCALVDIFPLSLPPFSHFKMKVESSAM